MRAIPFRRILPIAHCALVLVTYTAMVFQNWEHLRRWDQVWMYSRSHGPTYPSGTGPVDFNDRDAILCHWPYGWKVVIAFNLPAMLATGGTMLSCASEEPVGLRNRVRPLVMLPLMAGILAVGVSLQWWLIGKWLDRLRRTGNDRSRFARFLGAVFLVGPTLMGLGYWTPIADYILISATYGMLLLWLFLLGYIPATWKKVRPARTVSTSDA